MDFRTTVNHARIKLGTAVVADIERNGRGENPLRRAASEAENELSKALMANPAQPLLTKRAWESICAAARVEADEVYEEGSNEHTLKIAGDVIEAVRIFFAEDDHPIPPVIVRALGRLENKRIRQLGTGE
jgi:hypothetical protein